MLKVLIIVFLSLLALIDIIAIYKPDIRKFLEKRKIAKRRKAFAKKIKSLEIK